MEQVEVNSVDENFQFHKGTIKADFQQLLLLNNQSFNSIKVQLRLTCLTVQELALVTFNSIKVQLRLTFFE